MRAWILAALGATFFAGMSTGVYVGHQTAPEPQAPATWIDHYLDVLAEEGLAGDDLVKAEEILRDYQQRVLMLKAKVEEVLGGQLADLSAETERRIDEIRRQYAKDGKR